MAVSRHGPISLVSVCVEGTVKSSKVVKFIKVVENTKTIMDRQ